MPSPPERKSIRLGSVLYRAVGSICSVTICARDRKPVFSVEEAAAAACETIRERATTERLSVLAFCVMPDHVHLLLSPNASCDIPTFVGRFKNLAQRKLWTLGYEGTIWQKSFYDHFLRREEDVEAAARYIFENPVRAGLVADSRDYRFCGSAVVES